MQPLVISEFTGLDLRKSPTRSDKKTLQRLTNLTISLGRSIESRPGTVTRGFLSSSSVGLFPYNGALYSVAPAARGLTSGNPLSRYLYIGGRAAGSYVMPADHLVELTGWELYEAVGGGASYPYVSVKNKDGDIEHHYGDLAAADANAVADTYVTLPATPSAGLLGFDSRLYFPSNETGNLYGNAISGGARDWTTPGDSLFIPIAKAAPGGRDVVAMTYFRQYAAIFFDDSCQLWAFDENPDNLTRVENFAGIGTPYARTAVNVLGDTFYMSRGGFRRLSSAAVTGERKEDNIGVAVESLRKTLIAENPDPVSKWVTSRSQHLTAFGNKVLALTYNLSDKLRAWGYWEFPFTITEIAELNGKVYFRTGDHRIVELTEDVDTDDGEPILFDGKTQAIGKTVKGFNLTFSEVLVGMEGSARITAYPDPRDPEWGIDLGVWDGVTTADQPMEVGAVSDSLALGFTGQGRWKLDALSLQLEAVEP